MQSSMGILTRDNRRSEIHLEKKNNWKAFVFLPYRVVSRELNGTHVSVQIRCPVKYVENKKYNRKYHPGSFVNFWNAIRKAFHLSEFPVFAMIERVSDDTAEQFSTTTLFGRRRSVVFPFVSVIQRRRKHDRCFSVEAFSHDANFLVILTQVSVL